MKAPSIVRFDEAALLRRGVIASEFGGARRIWLERQGVPFFRASGFEIPSG